MGCSNGPKPSDKLTRTSLNVSQTLIDLIDQQYSGSLTRVGDDYDWMTADGTIIRLSVRPDTEFPTRPVDPTST